LAFAVCIYACAWEDGSSQVFLVGCIGSVAILLTALLACILALRRCFFKCCRRSSQDQGTGEAKEAQPDVVTSAVQAKLEKVHKEKIAKAKSGELDKVAQPEARAGDGHARSLSNLNVVVSQGLAFFSNAGNVFRVAAENPRVSDASGCTPPRWHPSCVHFRDI
jgi:hypothetical protein